LLIRIENTEKYNVGKINEYNNIRKEILNKIAQCSNTIDNLSYDETIENIKQQIEDVRSLMQSIEHPNFPPIDQKFYQDLIQDNHKLVKYFEVTSSPENPLISNLKPKNEKYKQIIFALIRRKNNKIVQLSQEDPTVSSIDQISNIIFSNNPIIHENTLNNFMENSDRKIKNHINQQQLNIKSLETTINNNNNRNISETSALRSEVESLKKQLHQLSLKNKGKLPDDTSDSSDIDSSTEEFLNLSFDGYMDTSQTLELRNNTSITFKIVLNYHPFRKKKKMKITINFSLEFAPTSKMGANSNNTTTTTETLHIYRDVELKNLSCLSDAERSSIMVWNNLTRLIPPAGIYLRKNHLFIYQRNRVMNSSEISTLIYKPTISYQQTKSKCVTSSLSKRGVKRKSGLKKHMKRSL